jgi:PrtD family type I secretion system ABC transporter
MSDFNPTSVAEHPLRRPIATCRSHLIYAGGASALVNILYLAPTIYMLQVYDRVVPSQGVETLGFLTALLLMALATLSCLEFIRSRLLVRATLRLERTLTAPLLTYMLSERGRSSGAQLLRDFDIFRQAATGPGVLALFDAPWIVIYVALCFLLHPALGFVAALGSVVLVGLTLATERATKPRLAAANDAVVLSYASQAQSAAVGATINALGMAPAMVRRHQRERSNAVRLQAEASLAAGGFMGLSRFTRLSLQSLALGVGAYLALNQQISAGAIFAASLLTSRALGPIEQLLGSWRSLTEAYRAYGGLKALARKEETQPERTLLPRPRGHLAVEQLTALGTVGQRPLLLGVGFTLEPGEVLGLVGPSGAGKSTLARALVGALRPNQGCIRLDGADIADWAPERLGRDIGYLPQDLGLLPGSIKQNICRFRDQLDEEDPETLDAKAIHAAKLCGAHEMILQLPQGYDTLLGPGGAGVSIGQAQRIALARALFGDPNFVVLDEPNAHLDGEGEAGLLRALLALKQRGAAVVVIAHRNSILAAVDDLLVLSGGRVLQRGPRDEVLARLRPPAPRQIEPEPQIEQMRKHAS